MDPARYATRPFVDTDYAAMARIEAEIDPDFAPSAAEIRRWHQILQADPAHLLHRVVVEDRRLEETVAYGSLEHAMFMYHPRKFWIGVEVRSDHRHLGIARRLYAQLEREAQARDALVLWASVREDDPRSLRFLEQQGFALMRRQWHSRLDIADARLDLFPDRTDSLAGAGIRFTTLAEEGAKKEAVRLRLFRLHQAVSGDVPRIGEASAVSFEQFVAVDLDRPGSLPEGVFLAVLGDEYVGLTTLELEDGRPGMVRVGLTGTRREVRGRGVASELKRRAVAFAQARGFRSMVTVNDSLNAPIWAINEKLGFRPTVTWLQGEKSLDSASPSAPTRGGL
jgi:mycothiol synthase